MRKTIEAYRTQKPVKKVCQARVDASILEAARRAAKQQKMKFQEAVETSLKWFIEQTGGKNGT